MNIGGALGTAGKRPLGEFEWGETIVGICNSHLNEKNQLLLTDSGNDAYAKIATLKDAIQIKLLSMEVGTILDSGNKTKATYVRAGLVMLSVVMAMVSTFATYHFNPTGVGEEEKSQMTQALVSALQTLLQVLTGI